MTNKVLSYNLGNVFRLRDKLLHDVALPYYGCSLEGEDFYQFVRDYHRAMPNGIPLDTLYASMSCVSGIELTMPELEALSWRLAGNVSTMKTGVPVRPWSGPRATNEWVPLQVVKATLRDATANRPPGYLYQFKALAGSPCSEDIFRRWPRSAYSTVARHVGFSAPWGKYPFSHAAHLVSLRFYGLFTPDLCQDGPNFYQVKCPASLIKYNRRILTYRLGDRPDECPRGYTHECHRCTEGYDTCPGGTHRQGYTRKICPLCSQESWFDSDESAEFCIACIEQEA